MTKRYIIAGVALLLACLTTSAQNFFNLTADEVRILPSKGGSAARNDSLLPVFTYKQPLGRHYDDSVYSVAIQYPEYIPMTPAEVACYQRIARSLPPEQPSISQLVSVERKQGELVVSFVPLVYRDGQYQKLVSFKLDVKASKKATSGSRRASDADSRYASHSVLATGRWAKISVPSTGIYELTSDLVRRAGFSNINKVKVYGYGGALQPEQLTGSYLAATDDLQEVATCSVNGRRLFHAVGPVSWDSKNVRVRNPYSDKGYYFLTENDDEPLTVDAEEFLQACYPLADDYNTLYEIDDYAWYEGGRNLYDSRTFTIGTSRDYTVAANPNTQSGWVTVALTAYTVGSGNSTKADVSVNGTKVGTLTISPSGSYDEMRTATQTFQTELQASNKITISHTAGTGGTMRLDYISVRSVEPASAPDLTGTFPVPEFVYQITNQDHHADTAVDMVIIIPTSQKLLAQAERLKALHEEKDGLRVRIVPADELYNEFSSGTPDANAYRRYLKMLYDRAETEADMPSFLLLFGDGAWDNRLLTSGWQVTPDDMLLCYESDNSYSHTDCYVSDDYFCLLDDGEGGSMITDKGDVAVGRISAGTADEAAIVVDKITSYMNNEHAGAWQNEICFMGDDGNENAHMEDADSVAQMVEKLYPTYQVKRIMWDAYNRVSSSTGNTYPDVTRLIKQQMQQGALLMNYAGHGRLDLISHESVLSLSDFKNTTTNLPVWLTASCDIMPFDGHEENIGETALFNKKGGAVAFYGTTRTVYQNQNFLMNLAFTRHALSKTAEGKMLPIGEAVRRAKNELIETGIFMGYDKNGNPTYSTDRTANKLQYTLLGDPAMRLAAPTQDIQVDAINGMQTSTGEILTLGAGSTVTVSGRVLTADGQTDTGFNGTMTATVRDVREQIVCKLNDPTEASDPFVFHDRPNVLFKGSDQVKDGNFKFTFAVPKDISYSDLTGMMNIYAVNDEKTQKASGICEQLSMGGSGEMSRNETGPSIYCYLNNASFNNGGYVNPTPYFVAQLSDEDGINATGGGIGHDLQLIIDGDMSKTYSLNDYFQYDFGSYTSGTVGYSIPELPYGEHKLLFRAWDILNNSSTAELTFHVVKGLEPSLLDVECTANPATTKTSFRILHDRQGSEMDVVLDVFDTSGRHIWSYGESGVSTDGVYTIDWDLTVDNGQRLHTGVYLYRVRISSDGSSYASKAKKLIVLTYK